MIRDWNGKKIKDLGDVCSICNKKMEKFLVTVINNNEKVEGAFVVPAHNFNHAGIISQEILRGRPRLDVFSEKRISTLSPPNFREVEKVLEAAGGKIFSREGREEEIVWIGQ